MTQLQNRPNILWICTDQQRFDTIGAMGNPHVRTPNIDQLASEGVAFNLAFSQCPICTPSRASFLTGKYASTVHACMNGNECWAEAAPLVTRLLADAGYDCGLSGKLHLAGVYERIEPRPVDDGYRVFHWSHHSADDWLEGHDYGNWLRENGIDMDEFARCPENISPEFHQTTWCANKAIEFMEEQRDSPWLMSVNPFDPHAPFDPPREIMDTYDVDLMPAPLFRGSDLDSQQKLAGVDFQNPARRPEEFDAKKVKAAYYAMIELIDRNVGRMLDVLERIGQRENTIVIFMSDHGETLGDHGLLLKGCRFYESLVRVPLIISWPGKFSAGVVSQALVELTDIAPTLLAAAGLPVPDDMHGRSLLPILTGQTDLDCHRDFVRSEYYRTLTPSPQNGFGGSYATMIRTRQHKLVAYHGHDIGELFDLENDPGEFDNLWENPAHADTRFQLLKQNFDALAFAVDVGTKQILPY